MTFHIITVNEGKGLYELSAYEIDSEFAESLISPCSLAHAKKQFANILHSLSSGAAACRVYDEDDETTEEDNTQKEQSQ